QACIDDNLDMVEFLVQNGADVNRKDNEGWTPLHATSSCGFLSIARYLIENGADLAAINSDGELALDLACSDAMEDLIQRHIDEQGIDCEDARQAEEKIMLSDAKRWLRTDSTDCDKPHPKTGATALHVAAAKGYTKVLGLLLDGRGDFDKQDVDGWTALHAAAYWGQKEAVQMLLSANVDIDIQNYSGQYAIDIAQKDIVPLLDEARKNFKRPKRRPAKLRIPLRNSIETPTKVIRVEVKPIDSKEQESDKHRTRNRHRIRHPPKVHLPWRRARATPTPVPTDEHAHQQQQSLQKFQNGHTTPDVILRRTQSFESDENTGSTTGTATTNVQTATTSPPTSPTGTPVTTPSTGQIRRKRNNRKRKGHHNPHPQSPAPQQKKNRRNRRKHPQQSFVPPTRDEESETQRKAHAKRVRETRRSTQGVTLDEIKSAEQLVKKKNSTNSSDVSRAAAGRRSRRSSINGPHSNAAFHPAYMYKSLIHSYQQSDPSSTTATASTPSTTSTSSSSTLVNDRVPSVDASASEQQVSASFTISAPPSSSLSTRRGGDTASAPDEDSSSKISVSYTITTPRLSSSITSSSSSDSATIAKDSKSKEASKTDSDDSTKTTTTTTATTKSTITPAGDSASIGTPASSTSVTATVRTPGPYSTSKRSLFDIDNANSLTLAEKLRQEANKYAESDKENFVSSKGPTSTATSASATTTTKSSESTSSNTTPAAAQPSTLAERRPSWRLKVDGGSKFKLEDASVPPTSAATTTSSSTVTALDSSAHSRPHSQNELNSISMSSLAQRRQNGDSSSFNSNAKMITTPTISPKIETNLIFPPIASRPTSAPELGLSAVASSQNDASLHLRVRPLKASEENKENDKENENRTGGSSSGTTTTNSSAQATQAVIQRRRRQKRRSTGLVHVDMEDIDPERQDSPVDGEEKEVSDIFSFF
ncbi:AAEL012753-PA, partial [Aedes aegypti]